ncbi:MAG: hypothetical protein WA154_07075 [Moraxellaceae bacterium]
MSEFNHSHPVHTDTARADVSQSELAAPHNMPVDFAPFQLPLPVAFIWGAFLLDGVITAKLPDQPAEHSVLSVWRGGLDDLINFNTEVLDHLQQQLSLYTAHPLMPTVQAYWQRKPLPVPNVFEYLVVNALGEYIGKYILRKHGRLPTPIQCQRQIHLHLTHFFP